MRNSLIICLIIVTATFTSCCSSSHKNKEKVISQPVETSQTTQETKNERAPLTADRTHLSVNHSYLTEDNVGEKITVKGKLLKSGTTFSIIENPDSKSKVTFVLTFENDAVKNQLTSKTNDFVQVSGVLTSVVSTWKKEMKVLAVE